MREVPLLDGAAGQEAKAALQGDVARSVPGVHTA